jgi:tRNA A37 threonylcarbamoyladenosine synthetase subunit TsaC/SUA5/YrdC
MPAATSATEAAVDLADHLDAVIDAGASPGGAPSTIVQFTRDGPRLLRAGAISWERVLKFVE